MIDQIAKGSQGEREALPASAHNQYISGGVYSRTRKESGEVGEDKKGLKT